MFNRGDIIGWNSTVYEIIEDNGDGTGCVKDITPDPDSGVVSNNIISGFNFTLGSTKSYLISSTNKTLTELEYLKLFYQECDFGPSHSDVIFNINKFITDTTGKDIPIGYEFE